MNVRPKQQGFTLIEVSVALFIVALFLGMLLPRLDFSDDQYMRREALRFRNLLEWATDQALYSGRQLDLVIDFNLNRYHFETPAGNSAALLEAAAASAQQELQAGVEVTDPLMKARTLDPKRSQLSWMLLDDSLDDDKKVIRLTAWGPEAVVALQFSDISGEQGYQVLFAPAQQRPTLVGLP